MCVKKGQTNAAVCLPEQYVLLHKKQVRFYDLLRIFKRGTSEAADIRRLTFYELLYQ